MRGLIAATVTSWPSWPMTRQPGAGSREKSLMQVVDNLSEADAALVWVMPSTYQISAEKGMSITLNKDTGIDVAKVKSIESKVPTVLVINLVNPWVINEIEPKAAAVLATFGLKGEALLDVISGRFNPTGKLPLTIPKDQ